MMFIEQFGNFLSSEVITFFERRSPGKTGREDVLRSGKTANMTGYHSAGSVSLPWGTRLRQLVYALRRIWIFVCGNEYIIIFYNYKN